MSGGPTFTLPAEVTPFERGYLLSLNRRALFIFAIHLPFLVAVASATQTGAGLAAALWALVAAGPLVASLTLSNPRRVSEVHGIASMLMGGLLVHFGQGPMQIEMHFYFFVALAVLIVFGNPRVVLLASLTVVVHHLVLYLLLPASVFNHEASLWTIAVHTLFIGVEAVGASFVARAFFDNVIGLEHIVEVRTRELDQRNADLRVVLDTVAQGLLTCALDGRVSAEVSRPRPEPLAARARTCPSGTTSGATAPPSGTPCAMDGRCSRTASSTGTRCSPSSRPRSSTVAAPTT